MSVSAMQHFGACIVFCMCMICDMYITILGVSYRSKERNCAVNVFNVDILLIM